LESGLAPITERHHSDPHELGCDSVLASDTNHAPKTCFRPFRIWANRRHNCVLWEDRLGRSSLFANPNGLNWLSALYGPTLSSNQMLPDSCAMVNTSLSWVRESPTKGIHLGIINRGLSNFVT